MTLDGTNTWVLREPGGKRSVVVDPGPSDSGHLAAVAELAGTVGVVLLTHGHADHSEGAKAFATEVGCEVRALDPTFVYGGHGLRDGDVVSVDGLELRVVGTPGHTSDSLSFVLPADSAILTGDTVLGRGTTVVAHPDGELGAYLDSLRRLRELAEAEGLRTVLPGHGPVLDDALTVLDHYLTHRAQRLDQVREAILRLSGGPGERDAVEVAKVAEVMEEVEPMEVVRLVYADVDERLWPAAELSVRAQLDYLGASSA
jgi:glyoxylase-like metal-dependent hydrolase (beta-lactamase superfamily II)